MLKRFSWTAYLFGAFPLTLSVIVVTLTFSMVWSLVATRTPPTPESSRQSADS